MTGPRQPPNSVDLALLPDWPAWQRNGVDSTGYLAAHLDLGTLARASRLFWPEFVLVEGLVLLADGQDDAAIARWRAHLGDDPRRLEATLNQRRLPGLVNDAEPPLCGAAVEQLGRLLQHLWQTAVDRFVGAADVYTVSGRWDAANEEYTLTVSRA